MIARKKIPEVKYYPALDGLRGIAILMVIAYHYFSTYFFPAWWAWTGVDVFFVLSGFLITSRLISSLNRTDYFSTFYKNRAFRILPLYFSVLILFFLFSLFVLQKTDPESFHYYNHGLPYFFSFLQNWFFILHSNPQANYLQHFWSLAVEEQFYLIWPLFIYFFYDKKYFNKLIYIIIFSIIITRIALYISYEDYLIYFYNSFCRMDGFIIGGLLCIWQNKVFSRLLNVFVIIAFCLGFFYFKAISQNNIFYAWGGFTLLAWGIAIIIRTAIKSNNLFTRFLEMRWLKYLGKISYGLYIFHFIFLIALQPYIKTFLTSDFFSKTTAQLFSLIVSLLISIIVSAISFRYFESYFLKFKKHNYKKSQISKMA